MPRARDIERQVHVLRAKAPSTADGHHRRPYPRLVVPAAPRGETPHAICSLPRIATGVG